MSSKDYSITEAENEYVKQQARKQFAWQTGALVIQGNAVSRLSKLWEAAGNDRIFKTKTGKDGLEVWMLTAMQNDLMRSKGFVLTHDWHAACGEAIGSVDPMELKQPYPVCAFELRVSGVSVIGVSQELVEGGRRLSMFSDIGSGMWMEIDFESIVFRFCALQIQAALVAMDAEIASSDVIAPPAALNAKRIKSGKTALPEYRVVRLARRSSAGHEHSDSPTGRHPRLHFRRGHWRHYEDKKTWINWTLVGNPDLGFIDKHYKL